MENSKYIKGFFLKLNILYIVFLLSIPVQTKAFTPARTDKEVKVKPGDIIDDKNWQKVENILFPGYVSEIKKGLVKLKIVETKPVLNPKKFIEATKKNAGKTSIDKYGGMVNYKAGIPFPYIDTTDDQAGIKLMWNQYWHWIGDDNIFTDGFRYCINSLGQEIIAEFNQAFFRTIGRTVLEPTPVITGFEDLESYFVNMNLFPRDASGTTVVTKRYVSPMKEDDMWIYIPSLRRVRRFPTSQRCATIAPTIYTHDDTNMFRGKVPKFNYRYLEDGKVLAICHQKHYPAIHMKGSATPQDEDWEIRDVWIAEQTPKDPSYCYSKRIFYFDKQFFEALYGELFDRKGELWKLMVGYTGEPNGASIGCFGYDLHTGDKTQTAFKSVQNIGLTVLDFSLSNLVTRARMGKIR